MKNSNEDGEEFVLPPTKISILLMMPTHIMASAIPSTDIPTSCANTGKAGNDLMSVKANDCFPLNDRSKWLRIDVT